MTEGPRVDDEMGGAGQTGMSGKQAVWLRLGMLVVGLLAVGVVTGVIHLPSIGGLLADVSDRLGAWTYLLVPGLAFFETAAGLGMLIPGETDVLVGGVVAESGDVSLAILIPLVWMSAVAGDLVSFLLGRRLGARFLHRHAGRFGIKPEHLERLERLFARHGGKTIVLTRFIGVLRAFTPFVAGASGMSLNRFLPYSVGAAFAWATLFTLVGYVFASSFASAGDTITKATLGAAIAIVLAVWIWRSLRSRAGRARPRPAPCVRPTGAT